MSITYEQGTLVAVDFQDGTPVVPAIIHASRYAYHHGLGDEVTMFQLEDLTDGRFFALTLEDLNRFVSTIQ